MRFHFPDYVVGNTHPLAIADAALIDCKERGTIAPHVSFKILTEHGRRGPGVALEIQLQADERDRGRRVGNSGSYGARDWGIYAATYDEWGFFIEAMFVEMRRRDWAMFCGSPKYPAYAGHDDFTDKTGRTYLTGIADFVEKYGDEYPHRGGRAQIGRRGAERYHSDDPRVRYAKYEPRTAEWFRDFHSGKTF